LTADGTTLKEWRSIGMPTDMCRPVRLVITGNDGRGRSRVVSDTVAAEPPGMSGGILWYFDEMPAPLTPEQDGVAQPRDREIPAEGGLLRVNQLPGWPADYQIPTETPPFERPGRGWGRGGMNIHKTQSVDYGLVLAGERLMWLDDGVKVIKAGDVLVQLGGWHGWGGYRPSRVAFIMRGATFDG
jgi:hypothetical protein